MFLQGKFHPEIINSPPELGVKQGRGWDWKNKPFSSLNAKISKSVGDTSNVTIK